ncbi:MAG TPA: YceD family protein, partial [Desulfobacter postgatei]|nr:YceD family protein [Desulfobacter postgatei]
IVVEVLLPCDRGLCDYPFRVDTAFQLLFALEDDEAWQVKALESIPSDLETEVLTEPVIDLDDVLRQQVYLALPV